MDNMDDLTVSDFTHYLSCRKCCGRSCTEYYMKCLILPSKGKKTKLLVFGERNWKGKEHIKKVRYVDGEFYLYNYRGERKNLTKYTGRIK